MLTVSLRQIRHLRGVWELWTSISHDTTTTDNSVGTNELSRRTETVPSLYYESIQNESTSRSTTNGGEWVMCFRYVKNLKGHSQYIREGGEEKLVGLITAINHTNAHKHIVNSVVTRPTLTLWLTLINIHDDHQLSFKPFDQ
jgi:hypothetical protein